MNKLAKSLSTIIERSNKTCLNQESSDQVRFKKNLVLYYSFGNYFDPDHLQIRYGYHVCRFRSLFLQLIADSYDSKASCSCYE